MPKISRLRQARLDDSLALFNCRNDKLTRENSFSSAIIDYTAHQEWLNATLSNQSKKLFIFEVEGEAVASSRLDIYLDCTKMSWSVYPEHRNRGIGRLLIAETLKQTSGLVIAEIKQENIASKKIALNAGMQLISIVAGICRYEYGSNS